MCKPLPQERFCMSATTPPGSPWIPTPMPPSGCGGRRQTPSAPPLARRCNNQSEKAQARTGHPRPGLLSLSISNAQSYITDFSVIVQIFFGCGPSMSRFSARSVPLHTPVWVTVWSEKNGKSKPLQRVLKNEKTVQITWICTAVSCVDKKDAGGG